jgi:endo-1,4-beta-xylanase
MKRPLRLCALLLAASLAAESRAELEVHTPPAADPAFPELPPPIYLWQGPAPGSEGATSRVRMHWENYKTTWYAVVSNIHRPAILPFLPDPHSATGAAVVVCPGGGHRFLAMEHEGYSVGTWLAAHGIAAFILEYRLSGEEGSRYSVDVHSLMDVQRAVRTVRARSREFGVNPAAVGVMGFSAGGEVAVLAATRFASPVPGTSDAVDAQDCRPDFQAILYPAMPKGGPAVSRRTPPAFLCGASDDGFGLTPGLVRYYGDLTDAGVPAELHVYATGGHGFGIRDDGRSVYSWMGLFSSWLGSGGFLGTRPQGR